ncbi:hypothetical protein UQW22_13260 [Isoptericola halotolerans]|uniref:hypothetical protein n=1 Tax=Isoptericola halotolerans TaxID=300560 RepID=UPI003890FF0A
MQTDDVLTVPADAADRTALLERLRALAAVDHPCVQPVGDMVENPDGTLLVSRGTGTATALPTVLAVRDRCDATEAAGIAVALAQGLAALHSAGVLHGPLEEGDVVVGADGRPRLRPRPDVPAGPTTEADDVHALARLVDSLVADPDADATVALRAALAPALAGDPGVRPAAGTLAARVDEAVPPGPVRLPEPALLAAAALGRRGGDREAGRPTSVRHRPARRAGRARRAVDARRSRPRRGRSVRRSGVVRSAVGAAVVLGGTGLAVALVLHVGGPEDRQPALAAAPTAAPSAAASDAPTGAEDVRDAVVEQDDPAAAAAELTRRRVELLAQAGPLDEVVLAGSPAAEAAVERLEQVAASGVEVDGVEVNVLGSRTLRSDARTAEVAVEYVVEEHDQTVDGRTTRVPADGPRTATLRLAWTDDGWRVAEVA